MTHYTLVLQEDGSVTDENGQYFGPMPFRPFANLEEVSAWINEEVSWLIPHDISLKTAEKAKR